jgi:hypothetical protein
VAGSPDSHSMGAGDSTRVVGSPLVAAKGIARLPY